MIRNATHIKLDLFVKDSESADNFYRDLVGDERILAGSIELPLRVSNLPGVTSTISWVRNDLKEHKEQK